MFGVLEMHLVTAWVGVFVSLSLGGISMYIHKEKEALNGYKLIGKWLYTNRHDAENRCVLINGSIYGLGKYDTCVCVIGEVLLRECRNTKY